MVKANLHCAFPDRLCLILPPRSNRPSPPAFLLFLSTPLPLSYYQHNNLTVFLQTPPLKLFICKPDPTPIYPAAAFCCYCSDAGQDLTKKKGKKKKKIIPLLSASDSLGSHTRPPTVLREAGVISILRSQSEALRAGERSRQECQAGPPQLRPNGAGAREGQQVTGPGARGSPGELKYGDQ